jgi:hypothetical protein
MDHGGKNPGGSGHGKMTNKAPAKKGWSHRWSRDRRATESRTGISGRIGGTRAEADEKLITYQFGISVINK